MAMVFIIASVLIVAFPMVLGDPSVSYLDRLLNKDFTQDTRVFLLQRYIYELDTTSFLLGHDVYFSRKIDPTLSTHNSFISIHQGAGVAGIFLILSMALCQVRLMFSFSPYAGILGAIIIRSLTDSGNFIGGFLMGSVTIAIMYVTVNFLGSKVKSS
jgi:hypothetical protein